MGKEEFHILKSTLASIEKMEAKIKRLTESKTFKKNKSDIEKELLQFKTILKNKKSALDAKKEQLEHIGATKEYFQKISEEIEDLEKGLKSVRSKISDLEAEHLDGEGWRNVKAKQQLMVGELNSNKSEKDETTGNYPSSAPAIMFVIGVIVGIFLIFGGGYDYECNDGYRISAFNINDGTEDCNGGEDESKAATEQQNLGFEMFACCMLPLGMPFLGISVGDYLAKRGNTKIELKVSSLIDENNQKYGDVFDELAYLERQKKDIQSKINILRDDKVRVSKLPTEIYDLDDQIDDLTNMIKEKTEKLEELNDTQQKKIKKIEDQVASAWLSIKDLIPYSDKINN